MWEELEWVRATRVCTVARVSRKVMKRQGEDGEEQEATAVLV